MTNSFSFLKWACSASLVTVFSFSSLCAEDGWKSVKTKEFFGKETAQERGKRMEWFGDARFGMFIHWGLYSVPAGDWKGEPVKRNNAEWIQSHAQIPSADYSELIHQFNPTKYDPEKWMELAAFAGMKYVVITSKHHEGFCLWDSKYTDFDVASTPYGKDLLKPLAEAARKNGLKMCWYHSILDWHHPDYGFKKSWRGNASNPSPDMDAYTGYMKNQLAELLTNYGDIGTVWFDGEWEKEAWTHERGLDLYNYCRSLQPNTLVNNRVDTGRKGMDGMNKSAGFAGDFSTPEQQIPETGFPEGVYWESCMTINDSWGYKTRDTDWKSTTTLIRNLVDVSSKGGNYLLNVGPKPDGTFPEAIVERLKGMGEWMRVHSSAIYGTKASPIGKPEFDGRLTIKENADGTLTIHVFVFNKPEGGKIVLKGLAGAPVGNVRSLTEPKAQPLSLSADDGSLSFVIDGELPNKHASVYKIVLKG